MTDKAKDKSIAAFAGAGVFFGLVASEIISDALTGQSYWVRVASRALAAGVLAAVFILVANRFRRP